MRKFLPFLFFCALLLSKNSFGQAVGDYGSSVTGTWGTGYSWLVCTAAGTWSGATTTVTQPSSSKNVWIRATHVVTVSQGVTATVNCKDLHVENGATLTLGNNATLVTLNCNSDLFLETGGTINSASTGPVQNLINMLAADFSADIVVDGNFGETGVANHLINIYPKIAGLVLNYKTTLPSPPMMYVNLIKPQFINTTTNFQRDVTITSSSVALGFANSSTAGYDNTTYNIDPGKTVTVAAGSVALTTSGSSGPGVGGGTNNSSININGTLIIGLNLSLKNIPGNTVNINVGPSGTLTVTRQFNLPAGAGNLNMTVNTGGMVNFVGGQIDSCNLNPAAANVTMNGTWDFTNTISNNINARGLGTATVGGKLVFSDAVFPASGITLGAGSTVEYKGTSAYKLPSSPTTYSNLTINNTVGDTLSTATTINGILTLLSGTLTTETNDLTLGAAASASLEAGTVLNINGGTTNFAGRPVTLKSNSTGTASIANVTGTLNGASNVTLQRYVAGGKRAFRFLAHPFSNTLDLSSLTDDILITGGTGFTASGTDNPSAFWYNPVTGTENNTNDIGWTAFTTTDGTGSGNGWSQYKGMRVLVRGNIADGLSPVTPSAVTVDATGQLNIGTQLIPVTKGTNSGFNFIGNPFASSIDLDTTGGRVILGSNFVSNYYVWDMTMGPKGGWDNRSFNSTYILPSFAGFIVKATANDNISITENAKTATAATGTLYRATTSSKPSMVRLWVKGNNINWDKFELYYNNESKLGEDKNDGVKLSNSEVNFFSIQGNKNYSIDTRPFVNGNIVEMGFTSSTQQAYIIKVSDCNLPANVELYLKDKFLGTETKLEEGTEYPFNITSNNASQGNERFELVQKQVPTLPNLTIANFSIKLSPNPAKDMVKVTFSNEEVANTTISITNAEGKIVKAVNAGSLQTGQLDINVKGLAKGNYYVTLNNGKERKTEKLIIQ